MAVQETDQPAFSTLLHSPTNCIGEEGRELLQNQLCPDTLPERERERESGIDDGGAPSPSYFLSGGESRLYSEIHL